MAIPATFADLQSGGGVMLHLPRHRFRADYSLAKLHAAGFSDIDLVEAVDGYAADARAVAVGDGWVMRDELADGVVANAVSMLRLWRRVVDEHLPYLMIFEDDVLPHPLVPDIGSIYWADTPPETDWVFMGNQLTNPPFPRDASVVAGVAFCTHAYIVSNTGAKAALSTLERRVAAGGSLHATDIELKLWMEARTLRHVCWNGTNLPKAFPTSDEVGADRSAWPPDVAWAVRDTGVFYQNFALGSTIHGSTVAYG